jgi:microcystin-dependent protein
MAADTYTTGGAGLFLMGTGNDIGTWGGLLNSNMIQIVEDAVTGRYASAATGGTLDLSGSPPPTAPSQARYAVLSFSGALISNLTVIVPDLNKTWWIENNTSGAFSLFVKSSNGASPTVQIPQGVIEPVRAVLGGGFRRIFINLVGESKQFFTATVPPGFLECDGSSLLQAQYPDLFAVIGTVWGSVDGTHFTLPNLKDTGRFLRSRTGALAVGTYQSNQNLAHTHTGSVNVAGSCTGTTDNTSIAHTHNVVGNTGGMSANNPHDHATSVNNYWLGTTHQSVQNTTPTVDVPSSPLQNQRTDSTNIAHMHAINFASAGMSASDPHNHTFTGTSAASGSFTTAASGGSEARPEAAVVLTCIRY